MKMTRRTFFYLKIVSNSNLSQLLRVALTSTDCCWVLRRSRRWGRCLFPHLRILYGYEYLRGHLQGFTPEEQGKGRDGSPFSEQLYVLGFDRSEILKNDRPAVNSVGLRFSLIFRILQMDSRPALWYILDDKFNFIIRLCLAESGIFLFAFRFRVLLHRLLFAGSRSFRGRRLLREISYHFHPLIVHQIFIVDKIR